MKIYCYSKCGTCKKALQYLDSKNIKYELLPIREKPPSKEEIKLMLNQYGVKRLFNTSGRDYRELNIKEKLPKMSEEEVIKLLNKNGNLIKRPFLIDKNKLLIGFKEEEWETSL